MTAKQFASQIGRPYRTVARWLARWHAAGTTGITKIAARGQGGAWRVDPSVATRWLNCDLIAPR